MDFSFCEAHPIDDVSSSVLPSASKMTSSFGNRLPAKLLDVPESKIVFFNTAKSRLIKGNGNSQC